MISLTLNLRIKDQYISDKTFYDNEQILTYKLSLYGKKMKIRLQSECIGNRACRT
jgi:hypothetical protein